MKTVLDMMNNNLNAVDVVLTLLLLALAVIYTRIWQSAKPDPVKG